MNPGSVKFASGVFRGAKQKMQQIYAHVDPKTVQYLAGHENSKITMDIYAKVKYNKPAELVSAVNEALDVEMHETIMCFICWVYDGLN